MGLGIFKDSKVERERERERELVLPFRVLFGF